MKVLLYMTTVLNYGGGLEKYLIETAAHLSKDKRIEQIDILTMDDQFTNKITDSLSVFYFKKRERKLNFKDKDKDINARLGKAKYFKCHTVKHARNIMRQYDVIYSKNEILDTFILKNMFRYKTIPPVILGGHTPLYYPNPSSRHAKLHNFLYRGFIYKSLAKHAAGYHALNASEAENYSLLFGRSKVHKIYNPFDMASFRNNAKSNKYDLPTSKQLRILWVGRLTEQKGIQDLVNVIENVNKTELAKKIRWTIVGDGEDRKSIEVMAEKYENVDFVGFVEPKLMPSLYSQHDVFISTSKWEGYPYNILEAMSFGLVIVGYNIPGVSDILKEYKNGYIFDDIKTYSQGLKKVIKAGKPHKNSFNYQLASSDPLAVYDQIITMFKKVSLRRIR